MCKKNQECTEGAACTQTLYVCALWWPSGEWTYPRIKECQRAKKSKQNHPRLRKETNCTSYTRRVFPALNLIQLKAEKNQLTLDILQTASKNAEESLVWKHRQFY